MEKVYLVRYGCYSDQGIAGAFSTEEKAMRYCEVHNELNRGHSDPYWVDDIIVDLYEVNPNAKVVTYYIACISIVDDEFTSKGEIFVETDEKDFYTKSTIVTKFSDHIEVKSVKSMEHAGKVAIEQYQIHTQQELENGKV